MNINANYRHLELVLQRDGKKLTPKKITFPKPESVKQNLKNRGGHSQKLYNQATSLFDLWSKEDEDRNRIGLPVLTEEKPFLVQIPAEYIDIDYLRSTFGLEVVCEYEDGVVIVATKIEDFQKSIQTILDFAYEVRGSGNVAKINNIIVEETKAQRLQRILSDALYSNWDKIISSPEDTVVVEMSIECQGTIIVGSKPKQGKNETDDHYLVKYGRWEDRRNKAFGEWDELCRKREAELERIISSYGGEIINIFDYIDDVSVQDSFEIKAEIPHKCLVDIAQNYPFVFEIKLPDTLENYTYNGEITNHANPEFDIIPPDVNSATVCVIDSGIQEGHVYIADGIKSELSQCFLPDRDDIDDEVSDGGHGTRVTGAILYPNGVSHLSGQQYQLPCFIANAKVLDENNGMPQRMLPSQVIGSIVSKYHDKYNIRLYNHSIAAFFPCLTKYMSSWASTMDNATYEKDILFIQAAGNLPDDSQNPFRLGVTQHLLRGRDYPDYLSQDSCRIPNPAQSMLALTVGALSVNAYEDDDWISFVGRGGVASYSCSGMGLWGSIKPEVVEYGGDVVVNKNQYSYRTVPSTCCELIRVSPPAFANDEIGTSFAAPKVSSIAAELQKILPDESILLYKALIIQSARWTSWANLFPNDRKIDVLRLMGYGLPNINRAITNDAYRITYATLGERVISAGYVHVYRVRVPQTVRNSHSMVRIDVTLTFAAKPRRTRKGFRGYFATWVDWMSSKFREDVESFARRIISMPEETDTPGEPDLDRGEGIPWVIGARNDWGVIKEISRSRSASQKDWAEIEAYKLPEEFCLAVIGHKGWCMNGDQNAKYSMCVSFEAYNNDLEIYEPFINVEVPIEAEQEIETEIEVNEPSE